jgi:hypothetical protein
MAAYLDAIVGIGSHKMIMKEFTVQSAIHEAIYKR